MWLGAKNRGYSPSGGSLIQSDWLTRSTAAGVTFATDFSGPNDFDQTKHVYGSVFSQTVSYWKGLSTHYTSDSKLPSCLKIASPADTGTNGAAWFCSLNPAWTLKTQGFGSTEFFVSVRVKFPTSRFVQRVGDGFKFIDISAYNPEDPQNSVSHTTFEHVTQNVGWHNVPICYRDNGDGQPPFGQNFNSDLDDIQVQDIDNGSGDAAHRYCLYNGGNYSPGCFPLIADTWITFKQRIKLASYGGTTGNEMDFFGMIDGVDTTWRTIYSQRDYQVGDVSDGYDGGMCGVTLTGYETNYDGSGTTDTYQLWSQLIISTSDIAAPAVGA